MKKCTTVSCNNEPTMRVFWPGGEPLDMCTHCMDRALKIGQAMGCYIHAEPCVLIDDTKD